MKTARRILLIAFVVLVNVFTASMVLPFILIDSDLLNDTEAVYKRQARFPPLSRSPTIAKAVMLP